MRYVPLIVPVDDKTRVIYSRFGTAAKEAMFARIEPMFARILPDIVFATNSAAWASPSLSTSGETVMSMLPDVVFRSRGLSS